MEPIIKRKKSSFTENFWIRLLRLYEICKMKISFAFRKISDPPGEIET